MRQKRTAKAILLLTSGIALIIFGLIFKTHPPVARITGQIVIIGAVVYYFGNKRRNNEH